MVSGLGGWCRFGGVGLGSCGVAMVGAALAAAGVLVLVGLLLCRLSREAACAFSLPQCRAQPSASPLPCAGWRRCTSRVHKQAVVVRLWQRLVVGV